MKTVFGLPAMTFMSLALVATPDARTHASPADNKAAAVGAMTDIFTRQDPSAVDRFFASPYEQHNARIPNGLDALKQLAQWARQWHGVHTTIHRALADGDLVVLHSAYWNLLDKPQTAIAFDLFRFNKDGKIVEHWDALEPQAKTAAGSQVDGSTRIRDLAATEANRITVLAYIDQVVIAGNTGERSRFVTLTGFKEHRPRQPRTFDPAQGDLTGSVPLPLSEVHYIARHRVVAEGNFVFVQGEGKLGSDRDMEIYDLFRLKDGKIVEHWDVHAQLPPVSDRANTNGPF